MRSLDNPMILRKIIMDHYDNPRNHGLTNNPDYIKVNMNSATCIDNIDVEAKIKNNVIEDIKFDGEACAISTASTSIMTELVMGKTIEEAKYIREEYLKMLNGEPYDANTIQEAIAFKNTYKQANRIKCASIGWNALEKLIEGGENDG